jgi:hypothetical protein
VACSQRNRGVSQHTCQRVRGMLVDVRACSQYEWPVCAHMCMVRAALTSHKDKQNEGKVGNTPRGLISTEVASFSIKSL